MAYISYRCGNCALIHDTYGEALNCCQPPVTLVYKCEHCGATYNSEAYAVACYAEHHETH